MADIEERFLQRRQQRDDERVAGRQQQTAAAAEQDARREAFHRELTSLRNSIQEILLVSPEQQQEGASSITNAKQQVAKAVEQWHQMQSLVRNTIESIELPSHDIRQANSVLETCLEQIEKANAASRRLQTQRFKFTSCKVRREPLFGAKSIEEAYAADTHDEGEGDGGDNSSSSVKKNATSSATTSHSYDVKQLEEPQNAFTCAAGESSLHIPPRQAVFVRHCKNATIFIDPTQGSVFLAHLEDCTIYAACHQMRIKACHRCHVYVWCLSTPVIEESTEMGFGPFSVWRSAIESSSSNNNSTTSGSSSSTQANDDNEQFPLQLQAYVKDTAQMTNVKHYTTSYQNVDDFLWLKQQKSPNWFVVDEAQYRTVSERVPPQEKKQ